MMFYLLVNSYGHFKMVSSPNHIFLDKFDYAASLFSCVSSPLITTFVHAGYDYSLYVFILTKNINYTFVTKNKTNFSISATQNL